MIMIDTDVLIEFLRGNEGIRNKFNALMVETDGYLYLTPIQIAEIYAGIREHEKEDTKRFLDGFLVIEIDKESGRQAGGYINKYRKSHGIELADTIIGTCTKNHGLKLWTLNKKHYPMFKEEEYVF